MEILSFEKISGIKKIREVLVELTEINSLHNEQEMESCKKLIRDYFTDIKPFLRNQ